MKSCHDIPGPEQEKFFSQANFTALLHEQNQGMKGSFSEWIFSRAMLFKSPEKWWGDSGRRDKLHEGIDLCLFRDANGKIQPLDSDSIIPAIFDGKVMKIMNDFLGRTIIMEHFPEGLDTGFLAIYGHTSPLKNILPGKIVKKGDAVCTISKSKKKGTSIPPHLHITTGIVFSNLSYEHLDWKTMAETNNLKLFDPAYILNAPFCIIQQYRAT